MATTQVERLISLPRGASLVGDYGEIVKLNSSGQVVLADAVTERDASVLIPQLVNSTSWRRRLPATMAFR